MNGMTAAAGAAVAAATRIYTDELDRILDRFFPKNYEVRDTTVVASDGWVHACDSSSEAFEIASILTAGMEYASEGTA